MKVPLFDQDIKASLYSPLHFSFDDQFTLKIYRTRFKRFVDYLEYRVELERYFGISLFLKIAIYLLQSFVSNRQNFGYKFHNTRST